MKNQKFIVFYILILAILFLFCSKAEATAISETRKKEIETMKDKQFYEDEVLSHLGWTKKDLLERYENPDQIKKHYLGGEEFYYKEKNIVFVLTGEEGIVNNLYLFPGAEILGIRVGMTFKEIQNILTIEPRFYPEFDEYLKAYSLVYFLGDQTEDIAELELWIYAEEEKGSTKIIFVLWKKYWR